MSISGLVITLSSEPRLADQAREELQNQEGLELGEACAGKIAAVLETRGPQQDLEACDRIRALTGVIQVDVVFVGLHPEKDA